MPDEPELVLGESRVRYKRTWASGHKLTKVEGLPGDGWFTIRCLGVDDNAVPCGWHIVGLMDQPEPAEEAAYLHRTKPHLLIAGSSDILKEARVAEMKAARNGN